MAAVLLIACAVFGALSCLYPYVVNLFSWRRFNRFAKDNGCKPVPNASRTRWAPLNVDIIYKAYRVLLRDDDFLDELFIPKFRTFGNTFGLYTYGMLGAVFTCEPENVKTMLATKMKDYGLEEPRAPAKRLFGNSIFTTDGAAWEHGRAMFRPQFSREKINDLYGTEKACTALFEAIDQVQAGQWTQMCNLAPLFYRFTLDASSEFLFGESTETQKIAMLAARGHKNMVASATAGQKFADALAEVQEWLHWRYRFGPLYAICELPRHRRALRVIDDYIGQYLDQAYHAQRIRPRAEEVMLDGKARKEYSLLQVLAEETKDRVELRDQLLVLIFAGRDSTASLLSWLFLCLALYPTKLAKLREEVLQEVGAEGTSEILDFTKLKGCKYLQFCLNETLRLFPPVHGNGRLAIRDTVLPTGGGIDGKSPIAIKAGTKVLLSAHAMHRREDIWGADFAEFKPERWNGRKLDWSYLPFNGGPRVCLGQQYALTEASYLTVRILQRFDDVQIAPSSAGYTASGLGADGRWGIRKTFGLVQTPRDGVCVRLRRAV